MHDEEIRSCLDLSYYRLERAGEDLQTAKNNYEDGNYRAANNRAYYSIFHSLRSVMALDQYDSKKHSDTIVTIFDCDRSERELLKVKWAIDETKLPEENKVYWKDVVNKGIEICRKDRERL